MNRKSQSLYFGLFFVLLLAFQNCSGFHPFESNSLVSNSKAQGGNGGGYEGKPDGTFYNYIPNYVCSGQSAPAAITEIKDGQAYLYNNQKDQCAQQSTPVLASDLNLSPFQNIFISVQDRLFKRYDIKPNDIPQDLAEVLCRDDFEKPTFEIVAHFDRETSEATAQVYSSNSSEGSFSISRVLSSTSVEYVSEKLSFSVDFSKIAKPTKKYAGVVRSSQVPAMTGRSLTCVIGGSLDTSNWSFRQLSSTPATSAFFLGQKILIPQWISQWVTNLFSLAEDGTQTDFIRKYFAEPITFRSLIPTADPNIVFFGMRGSNDVYDSWYLFQVKEDRMTKLTNLQTGPAKPTTLIAQQVTANQHLIYGEYESTTRTATFYDLNLATLTRSVFFATSIAFNLITHPLTNKVSVITTVNNQTRVSIYDVAMASMSILQTKPIANCTLEPAAFTSIQNDQTILMKSLCVGSSDSVLTEVAIADGSARLINASPSIQWFAPDKSLILLGDVNRRVLYNSMTKQLLPVPINPLGSGFIGNTDLGFQRSRTGSEPILLENRWLYGFGDNLNAPNLYRIDISTGESKTLCSRALGTKLLVGSLSDKSTYLFTYDKVLKIYRFYSIKNESECVLLNQMPSQYSSVTSLQPTSIGFNLLLTDPNSGQAKEIVFVPVDGRPPMKLSWTQYDEWQASIAPKNDRIIIVGPSADGINRVFSFDLF